MEVLTSRDLAQDRSWGQVRGVRSLSLGPSSLASSVPVLPFPSAPCSEAVVQGGAWPLCHEWALQGRGLETRGLGQHGEQGGSSVSFECTFLLAMPFLRFLHPGPGFIEHHVFSMFLNKN